MDKSKIDNFLDREGRAIAWPAKKAVRFLLLEYLASKFEADRTYSEKEVNEILKNWHIFSDWSLLRREMYNHGLFDRDLDGTNYRLSKKEDANDWE
jgi:hypothetical protein